MLGRAWGGGGSESLDCRFRICNTKRNQKSVHNILKQLAKSSHQEPD